MPAHTFAIVTAYNEAQRIEATLDALKRAFPGARLFVGDDGSTDATAQIARGCGAHVVRSERVIGKGAAATLAVEAALLAARTDTSTRTGTEQAVGSHADADADGDDATRRDGASRAAGRDAAVFLLCDGDLGESAQSLGALTSAIERGEADVAVAVFASRVGGGFGIALGFARWAIRRRCGLDTVAPISGQRALSEKALADVLPFAHGYGMEVGMTIDAVRAGHRVSEIELDLTHRASARTLAGFAHRGAQLLDFARVYLARGRLARA